MECKLHSLFFYADSNTDKQQAFGAFDKPACNEQGAGFGGNTEQE